MDIDQIRRTNIRAIEREFGTPTLLAEAVGMSYAQYVNLRDGAKDNRSGKPRGMRKETAWRFEDAGKKPRGWLDQQHIDLQSPAAMTGNLSASHGIRINATGVVQGIDTSIETISQALAQLPDAEREMMAGKLASLARAPDSPTLKKSISESLGSSTPKPDN